MKRMIWTACAVAMGVVLAGGARPAFAQCELRQLLPGDGAGDDEFGTSVSIRGDYAIIGSPKDDDAGSASGSAYLFKRNGAVWDAVLPKLTADNAAAGDDFGISVAIDGDYAVVGAPDGDAAADRTNTGTAYVFKRNGEVWSQQQMLVADDGASGDRFGLAVAIRGDLIAVGAPRDDIDEKNDAGSVYAFRRDGESWAIVDKLLIADIFANDQFGASVATDGTVIVAGASAKDPLGEDSAGAAVVFRDTGAGWVEETTLLAPEVTSSNAFGASVALSGDLVLIGETNGDSLATNTGAAHVFRFNGVDTWEWQAKLLASDGVTNDRFGFAVALQGQTALISATRNGAPNGAVYLFQSAADAWIQVSKITATGTPLRAEFGSAVSLDGSFALIGANAVSDNTQTGSAYIEVIDLALGIGGACVPCTGDVDCDDVSPLECAAGVCDVDRGLCDFDVASDSCLIDGDCVAANQINPADDCEECNPGIAVRGWAPRPNGSECTDDGSFCSGVEVCQAGDCVSPGNPCNATPSTPHCDEPNDACVECLLMAHCFDGVECTEDVCTAGVCSNPNLPAGSTCGNQSINTICDPADTCDGQGVCKDNKQPNGTECESDGNSCTSDQCFSGTCVNQGLPNNTPCDQDNQFCNGVEICLGGVCRSPTFGPCAALGCDEDADSCVCELDSHCDDGLVCTTDSCNLDTGLCEHDVAAGACLIEGTCLSDGALNPANKCESCSSAQDDLDWSFEPDGTSCDSDGNACTANECSAGECTHPPLPDTADCNDGQFCNGPDFCQGGVCLPVGIDPCPDRGCNESRDECICQVNAHCDDGIPCTVNICDTVSGACDAPAVAVGFCFIDNICHADGADNAANECEECNDALDADDWSSVPNGTACTDDGNVCTNNVCMAGTCTPVNNTAACAQDGLFCNGVESCLNGLCRPPSIGPCTLLGLSCNETTDTCVCSTAAQCADDLFCNGAEDCVDEACVSPGDPCEDLGLVCNEVTDKCGCQQNSDCKDDLFCNGTESCVDGECESSGNPCTTAGFSCNESLNRCDCDEDVEGVCDDGLFCTGEESCDDGECVTTGNPCTPLGLECDERRNICLVCLVGADCDDGDPCTSDRCPNGECTNTPIPGCGDSDEDGVLDELDNCPGVPNPVQMDSDGDGMGDVCDRCPLDPDNDDDFDGTCGDADNCPGLFNPTQEDTDADGIGDACDDCPFDADNDADGDGHCVDEDNCPTDDNPDQEDMDGDGIGDDCDPCPFDAENDADADDVCGDVDNCLDEFNPDQADSDADGVGDECDLCPETEAGVEIDANGCAIEDDDEPEQEVPDDGTGNGRRPGACGLFGLLSLSGLGLGLGLMRLSRSRKRGL